MYIDEFWGFAIIVAIIVLFVKVRNLRIDLTTMQKKKWDGRESEVVSGVAESKQNYVQEQLGAQPRYVVGDNVEWSPELSNEENHKSEFNIGANWLTIIGVISMIFGIGFFLDYAFSNNLISESGRVILGFISGIIFVILGDKFKNKLKNYSEYLMGGGFAIVMLSAYFGLEYGLYGNAVAFVLMLATTSMAGLLAHKLESKILGGTTILAGFLAPVLASSGVANEIVLFNYILILLGGMFWLVFKHGWNFLIWGSLLGAAILYGGSMVEYYTNSVFWIYWIYLIIFFGIFALAPVYSYFADKEDGLKGDFGSLFISVIAGGIFMFVSYFIFELKINGDWEQYFIKGIAQENNGVDMFKNFYWVIGLIPALVYLWLSTRILKNMKSISDTTLMYLVIGMASLSIAMIPALQFTGKWITFAWLIEAIVLGYIFYKNDIKTFLYLGVATLGAGLFRLFTIDSNFQEREWVAELDKYVSTFTPIINERTLIYFIGVASIFTFAYFAFQRNSKNLAKWLGIIGNLIILFWIYLELDSADSARYISNDVSALLLSVFYLIYAGLLIWIGVLKKYIGFRIFGLALIGFIILKTYLVDIWNFDEIIRILAFIILGGFILVVSFYYSKISANIKDFLKSGE